MTFRDLILKSKVYTLWLQKANTSPQGKHHAHLDTLKDIYLHKFLLRQCFIDIQNYNLNQIISCQSMSEAVEQEHGGEDVEGGVVETKQMFSKGHFMEHKTK